MNASLNPGQLARTLAVEFAARADTHDRDASFPFDNFAELQQAGLLALAAPDKPPLLFYLMAVAFFILGYTELAARLIGLMAGVIGVALMWR